MLWTWLEKYQASQNDRGREERNKAGIRGRL